MSRIGKQPLPLPQGVRVHAADGVVRVEGPKGTLERRIDPEVSAAVEGGVVVVRRRDDSRRGRSIHGLTRKLIGNMVDGVTKGFTRVLEINGVGYRAEARGNVLFLTLGYSHPIAFQLPAGISAKVDRQVVVTLEGPDLRPPEPYKGKGVKYAEETIRRKAGKAGKAAAGGTR